VLVVVDSSLDFVAGEFDYLSGSIDASSSQVCTVSKQSSGYFIATEQQNCNSMCYARKYSLIRRPSSTSENTMKFVDQISIKYGPYSHLTEMPKWIQMTYEEERFVLRRT